MMPVRRRPASLLCLLLAAGSLPASSSPSTLAGAARPLSGKEADQLARLARGEVGKDELEVVLAQFDEDLAWSQPLEKVRTVYCKGGEACHDGSEKLPNVGREGHTFLHHIVANYDKLAAWTVFSQAGEPTEGYRGHKLGGGHMLTGATFNDYLLHPQRSTAEDPGAFFLITSKLHLPTMRHSMRTSYKTVEGQRMTQLGALPPACPAHGAPESSSDAWGPYGRVPWLRKFVAQRCGLDETALGDAMMSFWDSHVLLPRPPADIAHFAQGARFATSRARIQQRPKAFYEKLLALVSSEVDPCMNYLLEWVWYYVIGMPESGPCDVTPDDRTQGWDMRERMLTAVSGVSGDDVETEVVITGSATLKVANPTAFCNDLSALDGFASGLAGLSDDLKAEWFTVDCEPVTRRLSEGSRRLEGSVTLTYTITIPANASAGIADTIVTVIADTTEADLKIALNTALSGTGFEVLEVTEKSTPTKTERTVTSTSTVTVTGQQATADSHAKERSAMDAGVPMILALLASAFSG